MIWALLIAIPLKDNVLIVALLGPITFGLHMIWQIVRLNTENKSNLLKLFRSNREAGLFPVLFFVIANML
jgi:4-hydroxybenzoate polyprenyltransferase